jgi:hypothetical protein
MNDRRQEHRKQIEIPVRIWGIDAAGSRYSQQAIARNISHGGALISGIEMNLRPGDLIGIQRGETSGRYRVVWSRDSGGLNKNLAAVQKLVGSDCPWEEVLPVRPASAKATGA